MNNYLKWIFFIIKFKNFKWGLWIGDWVQSPKNYTLINIEFKIFLVFNNKEYAL